MQNFPQARYQNTINVTYMFYLLLSNYHWFFFPIIVGKTTCNQFLIFYYNKYLKAVGIYIFPLKWRPLSGLIVFVILFSTHVLNLSISQFFVCVFLFLFGIKGAKQNKIIASSCQPFSKHLRNKQLVEKQINTTCSVLMRSVPLYRINFRCITP